MIWSRSVRSRFRSATVLGVVPVVVGTLLVVGTVATAAPAAASTGDVVGNVVAGNATTYTQSSARSDGPVTTTYTLGGTNLVQFNPAVQTMPQRGSDAITFSPNGVNTANVAALAVTSSGCQVNATTPTVCPRTGSLTIAFNKPVTNPTLHVAGLGGQFTPGVGAVQSFASYFDITGATALGSANATATFGAAPLSGSGLTVTQNNTRLQTATSKPAAVCAQTPTGFDGPSGCGSVLINGTNLTSVTLGTGLVGIGSAATALDPNATDAFDLTTTIPATPPFQLSLAKSNPASLQVGTSSAYALTVTNAASSTSPATGATVTDKLPANVAYESASGTGWTCTVAGAVATGQTLTCSFVGSIAPGASSVLTVNVTPQPGATGATVRNVAAVDPSGLANPVDPTTCTANGSPTGCAYPATQTVGAAGLTCNAGDLYGVDYGTGNLWRISPADGSQSIVGTIPPANGAAVNALAVTNGTGIAYAASGTIAPNAVPTIYRYDPRTGAATTFNGPALAQTTRADAGNTIRTGAINPVNGIYYFGFFTQVDNGTTAQMEVYGFNTVTNTPIAGRIATVAIPVVGNINGDLVFDRVGRMYFLSTLGTGGATDNPLSVVNGFLPTTGANQAFTSKVITYLTPATSRYNGMAFDLPTGYLYVTGDDANGGSFVSRVNPSSGAVLATYPLGASNGQIVDAASCNYNNSLTVQKNIVNKAAATDQFTVAVSGGGLVAAQTGTTTGTATGLHTSFPETAGPVVTVPGATYTVSESAAGTTNLANYTSRWVCVNLLTNAAVANGTGTSGTFTFPTPATNDGIPVGCTFTNSAYSLSLAKTNPTSLTANQPSTYGLAVSNSGPSAAPGATVVDRLPAGVAFTSSAGAGWTCTVTGTVAAGQTVTCTFTGTIAAGATNSALTITVTPTAGAAGSTVRNVAAVDPTGGANPVDPTTCTANSTPSGCAFPATQTVGNGVTLRLAKSAPSPALVVGYPSAYTFIVTNTGPNAASGATVRDALPAGLAYSSAAGAACTATGTVAAGQTLVCTLPAATTIAANGGTATFTVTVVPQSGAGTSVTNRAAVDATGGSNPPDPSTCTAANTPAGCAVAPAAPIVADVVKGPSPSYTTTVGTPVASIDVKSTTTSAQGKTIVNPTVTTQPANGTASVNADGTLRYVPNAGFSGVDTFTYTICNNGTPAACDVEPVRITVTNVFTPVAGTVATAQNTSVTTPLSGIATTSGRPLDPTRVTQVTAPAHGTLSISPTTGAVTYIPTPGYTGPDSYAVQVCDTSNPVQCTTITKTVSVGGNTVTAVDDSTTTPPGTAVTTNVRSNDTSQTGQALANPTIVTGPTKGTAVVNADGTITYTPTNGTSGADSLVYQVCDTSTPTPVCAQATLRITVANTVTAVNDAVTTPQNTAVTLPLLANDSVRANGAPLDPGSVTVTTAPTHGTVTVNAANGVAAYTPANGYTGTDSFVYRVCDTSTPTPVCASATATITIGANTVTAANDTATTTPGTAVTTNVRANDTTSTGQPLANPTIVTNPTKGTVAVDPATGAVTYTPNAGTSGVDTYVYRVCDTSSPTPVCAQATVTVNVTSTVTANPDAVSTAQNTPVTVAELGNDTVTAGGAPLAPGSVTVTTPANRGTTTVNANGTIVYTPANGFTGTDTFTYRVCDTSTPTPVCATAPVTVTVGGNTVTANPDSATTTPGTAVTTDVRANDTTGTGQPLALPTVTTNPTKGTVTVNANGTITYRPTAGTSGVDTYVYRVCDTSTPTPVCSSATVTVTVTNTVTVRDDLGTTPQNTPVTTTVLGNDTVATGGAPLAPGSVAIVTAPTHGTATPNADGTVTYTPANGYTGADSYVYRVCDTSTPTPVCGTATVNLTVGPNTVTAVNDTATTTPTTPVTVTVRANDTSQTGQPLANPTVPTQPAKGTATVNADGTITYTPNSGTSGTDTFTYRVCDTSTPTPVCSQATVTVTVTNTVTAVNDAASTPQNTAVTTPVLGNDTVSAGGAPLVPSTVSVVTAPAHGSVSVDTGTGAITYVPTTGYTGADSYVYRVCDASTPTPVCANATVNVTVGGNLVTARPDTATTSPGVGIGIDVRANDTTQTGQPLANPTIATAPAHGTATVTASSGRIIYTPAAGFSGTDTFTYQVCDTSAPTPVCSTATVTVRVNNTVTARDDLSTTPQNTAVTTTVLANDTVTTNGAPLDPASVTVTQAPINGTTVANPNGTVTYTPNAGFSGTDAYTYRVCDTSTPTPVCATATVTIDVGSNTVTASNDTATTTPGTAVTTDVRANDASSTGQPLDLPTIVTQPSAGRATVNGDGTITFTPANNTSGQFTYTYQVCDTSTPAVCSTATVTVTVQNTVTTNRDVATVGQYADTAATPTTVTTNVLANDRVSTNGAPLDPSSVTIVAQATNGTATVNPDGTVTYRPNQGFSGTDAVTYQVCDRSAVTPVCGRNVLTITVTPNVVDAVDDTATVAPGASVTTTVRANDTSQTGQSLAVPTIVTGPTKGSVTVNGNGTVTYTPNAGTSGLDTYVYRLCDTSTPTPACDTATVRVTVTDNVAANDDSSTTPQNTAVRINVLGNDTSTAGASPLQPASVAVIAGASNGSTAVAADGTVLYTPNTGFAGTDTFDYRVCDGSTPTPVCDTATVTVTVRANTVTVVPDTATTAPATAVIVNVLGNDTSTSGQAFGTPSVTVAPTKGTATPNPADGTITYVPNSGTSGTDTFTYRVCDTSTPTPVCGTATVTVTVATTVDAVADTASTGQNTAVTTTVLQNDTVTSGAAPLNPASVAVVNNPANGSTVVNANGTVTYTPASGFTGRDSYTYSVCDRSTPTPQCDTAEVTVTVGGNVVTATDDSATTAPATAVAIDVRSNDTSNTGQALARPVVTSGPANGSTSVDPGTGVITYTPRSGFSGVDSFDYRVCDTSRPTPVCDTATVTITVPSTVTAVADRASTAQNTPVNVPLLANDRVTAGGAPLRPGSVAVTTPPQNGTVAVDANGVASYTPANGFSGTDTFTYQVCDTSTPTPACGSATVTVTVGGNTVSAAADSATTTPGNPVTVPVRANDTSSTGQPLANPTVTAGPTKGTATVNGDGTITYTPNAGTSGTDTFTYRVCDTSTPTPVCSSATVTVAVTNTVTAAADAVSTRQNTAVSVPVLTNDSVSPGGAPLRPASVTVTTPAAHGTAVANANGTVTYTPVNGYTGPDSFGYQVCDTSTPTPVCATATVSVTVGGNTVTAAADTDTTRPGRPVTTAVRDNDSSSTSQPLANPTIVTAPTKGSVAVNADGTITYTPNAGTSGTDTYTYRVCDTSTPTPVCDNAVVTINVVNVVTARPDTVTVAQNGAVVTTVLGNDAIRAGGAPLNPASVTVTAGPTHGTTTVNADGTVRYVPTAGYSGPDSYTYQVCDTSTPTPVCGTATVSVTVAADTVTARADTANTVPGRAISVPVLVNDTTSSGQALANPTVTVPPARGTATVNPDGTVTYTPNPGTSGTDTFTYQVCDTGTTPVCTTATVTVAVTNTVAADDDATATGQNTPVTVPVLGNDTVSSGGAPLDPSSVAVTVAPAHGTATPNADGTVTYTPAAGYSGADQFTYRVCDRSAPTPVCDTATVAVSVGTDTVAVGNDTASTTPGNPVTVPVLANDSSSTGTPLGTPTIVVAPANGTVVVNPDGTITYTPTPGTSGTDTFGYRVCDASTPTPVCGTASVTVRVQGTVDAEPDTATVPQNGSVRVDVAADDGVGAGGAPLDPASVTVTGAPAHGTATPNGDGTVTYVPTPGYAGPDAFTYRICDTSSGTPVCSSATVTVAVTADVVTAVNDTATTPAGSPVDIVVRGNDTTSTGQALASPTVQTQPTKGTVVVMANGSITYTPRPGTSGTDSFTYQVCDTSQPTPVCATATVTVNVTSTVTPANDTVATGQNTPVTTNVLANDSVVPPAGAPLDPSSVTIVGAPTNGTAVVNADGSVTYTPTPGTSGTDSYTYQVCDRSTPTPVCGTATVTVAVGNDTVAANPDTAATTPGNPTTIDVERNDSSGSGQPLAPPTITVPPTNGTVVVNNDGTITYTPRPGTSGTDTFTYQVCDTGTPATCGTATVTVSSPNPVNAAPDGAATAQNTTVAINVLANDGGSPQGAPLDPGTVAITAPPANGAVTVAADGTITYVPNAGFSGTDTFTYQVCDTSTPTPVCDGADVTVSVGANIVDAADDTASTTPRTSVTVPVGSNDTSSTGQALTAPVVTVPPAHGTATVTGVGTIAYVPADGFSGDDTFTYRVCDTSTPTPVCDTATVTVTVVDTVAAGDDTASTGQNAPVAIPVLANDINSAGAAPLAPGSVTIVSAPARGTTSVDANGVVTYTPTPGTSGQDSFTYQVCDTSTPTPTCDTAVVTVLVGTNTVTASPDTAQTVPGTATVVNVIGNDTSSTGQPLGTPTISTPPSKGTAVVNPDGTVTYTPRPGTSGTDTFTYRVCDTGNPASCATGTVTVTVAATVTAADDTATTGQNAPVTVSVLANDRVAAGGAPLDAGSVTVVAAPTGGTATVNPDGTITYTPAAGTSGTDTFTYRVCDTSTPTPVCDTAVVSVAVGANTVDAQNDSATTTPTNPVSVDVRGNDTSASGQPLADPTVATAPAHGTVVVSNGTITYTPATGFSGTDTFTYQVCDTSATPVCDTATVTVTVTNTVTAVDDRTTTAQDAPVRTVVLSNDTVSSGGAALDPASVTVTGAPAHGTTTVNADGSITFTPATGYTGADSYTYRVCDTSTPTPVCDTATVTVDVGGNTVVAGDDSANTTPATAVTIDVADNDSSSTGRPLQAPTVTTAPAHGTAVVTAAGTIRYTPDAGFSGNDTFTYQVCDTSVPTPVCDTATVTVTVANTVVAADDTATTPQNTPVTTTVLGNDDVAPGGAGLDRGSVQVTVAPAHGSTTVNADGSIRYTPARGYAGPDSYTYRVCDTSTPTPVCDTATVTVTVGANAVTAGDDTTSTTPGNPVTVDVRGNDVSASGQPLGRPTVTVAPAHGTTRVNANGTVTYTPAAGFSGTDTFTYQVCDTSTPTTACDTAIVTVTVVNTVTAVDDASSTAQNTPVTLVVLGNDTVSAGGSPLDLLSVAVVGAPANGTTAVSGDGRITYFPATGFTGTDQFTYQVCDGSTPTPVCDTATVTVTVGGDDVTAADDSATTTPGTAVRINVLGNDSSSTGTPLGAPTVVAAPAHGTATVNGDGTITYTPAAGFSGSDSFTYQVCDGSTPTPVCDSATVTVSVPNAVNVVPDRATVAQNTPVTIGVLGNDTVTAGAAPLDPASLTVVAAPAHGTATVNPDGTITYTPAAGYSGPDSFSYQVCDTSTPTPVCGTATVSVTVGANTVRAGDDVAATPQDTPVTTTVLGNDTTTGAALAPASVTVTTPPAHGTAVANADGTITYTPGTGYAGPDSYGYQVCDTSTPTPVCDTATVAVTVGGDVVVAGDDTATTTPATAVVIDVRQNDSSSTGLLLQSPTVTTAPAHGTATVRADGRIVYTPDAGFSGDDSFTYQVCDTSTPTPVCDTATVAITVQNTVTAVADSVTAAQGTPVTTAVLANDTTLGAPLDPGSVTVTTAPAHGTTTVNPDGSITYTPAAGYTGPDSYTYRVCDTSAPTPTCGSAVVTVQVGANGVVAGDDTAVTAQNTPVTTNVLANDTVTGAALDPASVTVVTAPANGTTTVNADGTITYTPATGFTGTDGYTYRVCDTSTPTPVCDTATVTVTVGGDIVAANDDSATTAPVTPVVIDVRANDSSSTGLALGAPVVVTAPTHGTATVGADGRVTYTPAAGFSGSDSFTYRVCDTSTPTPVCDTATVTVTVPTTVTAVDDTANTGQNTATTTVVLGNDTVTAGAAPLDPASVTVTTAPAHGTTTVNADGSITYTPAAGYTGPDAYTYRVCDTSTPTPVCDSATVTVTVGGDTVIANDDTATTAPGRAVTIDVRGNDTTGTGQDLARPTVTVAAAHGTTVVNRDGTITYTPAAGFSGTDTFTYQVCDTSTPTPVCDTALVTIQVPSTVTAGDDAAATAQDTPVTTNVLANDTTTAGGAPLDPSSVTVTGAPAHGTTTVNADGSITYTPTTGYTGSDAYTYRVCDTSSPTPVCDTAVVAVTVGGDTVVAGDDAATTAPGTAVTIDVRSNDSSGTGLALTAPVVATAPAHGTATVNADGTVTYVPAAGFSGTDSFTYRVCDTSVPTPVCDTATVTVSVPSTVTAVGDVAATPQDTAVTTDVLANDTTTAGGAPLDPASVAVVTAPTNGTTTVNADGSITYLPATGFTGTDSYTYQVCDTSTPTPVCDTATVTVTVGGDTVAAGDDSAATTPGTAVTIDVRSNDSSASGLPLGVPTVTLAPAHGTTTVNADGTITYTPAAGFSGTDSFVYRVCDTSTPTPVCDTATVTVTVPSTVTAVDDTAATAQNAPVTTDVLANDTTTAGGAPLDPASVTVTGAPANGTTTVNADGTITYTPATGFSGTDSYTYRVCDTSSPTPVCDTATVTVTVGGNTVAAGDDSAATAPATAVTIDVRSNDSSGTGLALIAPVVVTAPAHGTTTVNADGTITYTPAAGFSGTDTFTYRVCDTSVPTPVCDTATVTVSVPSTVDAVADTANTGQDLATTTNVLANDTTTAGGAPLDPASVTVVTAPAHGTTTVNADGSITYTPATGYSGPDSYTYRVCDTSTPTPVCDTATVTITVGGDLVTANDDTATTTPVTPVVIDVRGNDTTGTGQPLANPVVTGAPAHGTATVNADGTITYTPAAGFSGTDTFTYRVCDTSTPTPVCDTATVTVTVEGTVTAADDDVATPQDTAVTTAVLANDTATGAPLDPASVLVTAGPAHGSTTVNSDGTITYVPATGYTGVDSYTYSVCDTASPTPVCDTATVTVTVGGNVVIAGDDATTTTPGTAVTIDVRSNDSSSTGLPLVAPTVTGAPAHGTATVNADGTITYTPAAGFSGTDTFTYRVCDTSTPTPVCDTATVTVTVPSTVTAVDDAAATPQNTPVTTVVLGNDSTTAGGAPLDPTSVEVVTDATHGTTTVNADGTITYTPARGYTGPDSYTYRVCDTSTPTPVCDTATVTLTVGGDVVVAGDDTATTAPATAVTIDVRSNDSASTGLPLADPTVTGAPAHGTATVNADGTITYTPAAGFSGTDTFTYQVCDTSTPTPVCDTATVTVTVPSVVDAVDDTSTTPQNTPVTTVVLGNDTTTAGGAPLDPTSVTVTTAAAQGTTTVNADGSITYTPANGYTGTDSYTYAVCDTSSPTPVCDTATVTLTVGPDVVTAVDDTATTTQGSAVTTPVLGNDTTSTGQPLDPASVTVTSGPAHGTTTVNPLTGAVTYVPDDGFNGTDSYTYQVCDTSNPTPVCDTATVTVTVDAVATGGLVVTKTGALTDVDGDGGASVGDTVSWTIHVLNSGSGTVTTIVVSDPGAGEVTCPTDTLAAGTSMDCTVPDHTVTAADIAAGSVQNTASATGVGPDGPLDSAPVTASVTLTPVTPPPGGGGTDGGNGGTGNGGGSNGGGSNGGGGGLAYTGVPSLQLTTTALLILLAGLLMLLVGRRRNEDDGPAPGTAGGGSGPAPRGPAGGPRDGGPDGGGSGGGGGSRRWPHGPRLGGPAAGGPAAGGPAAGGPAAGGTGAGGPAVGGGAPAGTAVRGGVPGGTSGRGRPTRSGPASSRAAAGPTARVRSCADRDRRPTERDRRGGGVAVLDRPRPGPRDAARDVAPFPGRALGSGLGASFWDDPEWDDPRRFEARPVSRLRAPATRSTSSP